MMFVRFLFASLNPFSSMSFQLLLRFTSDYLHTKLFHFLCLKVFEELNTIISASKNELNDAVETEVETARNGATNVMIATIGCDVTVVIEHCGYSKHSKEQKERTI